MHSYQDCDKKKILLIENAQRDDEICLSVQIVSECECIIINSMRS